MKKIVSIIGTTASGKSSLGIALAQKFNGEIISADSRQVYKGFNLGSGKVTIEEQAMAPHHLIDILEPNVRYSAKQFQDHCYQKIEEIFARGKLPFIVGGTGFYTRSIAEGYGFAIIPPMLEDKCHCEQAKRASQSLNGAFPPEPPLVEELQALLKSLGGEINPSDVLNKRRLIRAITIAQAGIKKAPNNPKYNVLQLCLDYPKEVLNNRILERLDIRIKEGMVEEIEGLIKAGATPDFMISLGLEELLFIATKQFAKRQRTWFNKDKNTIKIDMSKPNANDIALKSVSEFLKQKNPLF
jgi:tRNA dimethylallyltransferase